MVGVDGKLIMTNCRRVWVVFNTQPFLAWKKGFWSNFWGVYLTSPVNHRFLILCSIPAIQSIAGLRKNVAQPLFFWCQVKIVECLRLSCWKQSFFFISSSPSNQSKVLPTKITIFFPPNSFFSFPVCLFVCNRGDTVQYHSGLRSRELGQLPWSDSKVHLNNLNSNFVMN